MKITKVICKKQYPNLTGIIDLGDEIEIESILYDKRTVLSKKRVNIKKFENGKEIKQSIIVDDVVAEVGNYKGFRFKSKNGQTYSDRCLISFIGYIQLKDIFNKVN